MKLALPEFNFEPPAASVNPFVISATGALIGMIILVLGTIAMDTNTVKVPVVPAKEVQAEQPVVAPVAVEMAPEVPAISEVKAEVQIAAEQKIEAIRGDAQIELSSVGVEQSAFQFRLQRFIPEPSLETQPGADVSLIREVPQDLAVVAVAHETSPLPVLVNCNCLSSHPTYIIDVFEVSSGDMRPRYRDDPKPKKSSKKSSKMVVAEPEAEPKAKPKKKFKLTFWKKKADTE